MEDPELVNRREALAGLCLLGLLSVTLVVTVVYRIVSTAPGSPGPARPVSIVEVDPAPYGARATDPGYASALIPPADSIEPVAWPRAGPMDDAAIAGVESPNGVSRAAPAFESQVAPATAEMPLREAPRHGTAAPLTEAPLQMPELSEAPRFVAPAGR